MAGHATHEEREEVDAQLLVHGNVVRQTDDPWQGLEPAEDGGLMVSEEQPGGGREA